MQESTGSSTVAATPTGGRTETDNDSDNDTASVVGYDFP